MPERSTDRHGRGSNTLRPALTAFAEETVGLASATTGVWLRLLPRLAALTLLGWVAYHGAVFLAAEVAQASPWLLIPALSVGVVLRLATVVVALRAVATELGAPGLLRQVAPSDAVDDDRDRSLSRLLGITLLPFLAVYAAFGYVDSFARDVVLLSTYRFGPGELLQGLNPLGSAITAAITVGLVGALYVARRLLERWQERTGGVLPALLGALVEASGLFVVLLSAFRLVEGAQLWVGDRRVAQWWQAGLDGATGWLRIDLPDLFQQVWTVFAGTIWPVLWDVVSQPLAWLTLAALVFGSRVLTLGDVLRTGPGVEGGGVLGRAERLRLALARAEGPRRAVLRLQQIFAGDVDDKYLPTWKSLRLVLHAGWAFLGAYILLFNLVGLLGDWSVDAVRTAIGGQPVSLWINVLPFLDLLPDVLGMSLQLALLGAAFVRILQLRSPEAARVRPSPAGTGRLGEVAVVAALLLALVAMVVLRPDPDAAVRRAGLGERARYAGGAVQVDAVQLGTKVLLLPSKEVEASPVMFVAVHATVTRTGATPVTVRPRLVTGARAYEPQGWGGSILAPQPGFSESTDFVFEVLPSDVTDDLHLEFETRQLLVYYPDVVSVPLRLGPAAAAAAVHHSVVVTSGTQKAVA
ncbi:MAG TPA: hypothetical protein VGK18_05105 [Propionicimonas sp.]|uniref:hypothetical protein n=1 Tax=Propionicimonas sp. TaxID=1955623 RepID=UPI002F3F1BB9